jgi:DNA-binding NtrC family response regulator
MARILLVDDEPSILSVLATVLKSEDHDVLAVGDGEAAKKILTEQTFDLMISDIRMTPVNGMDLLKVVHEQDKSVAVIMLTAYGTVETAIQALKLGAFDYLTKPFKVDELLITVKRALDYNAALSENATLKMQLQSQVVFESIIAESAPMKRVCEMVRRVAPTDTTILISGESGTGKELIAKAIHSNSSRKDACFMPVNCAALPEQLLESEMFGHTKGAFTGASVEKDGLFIAAHGGTIFLDEISSMPMSIQSKLLRALQEREIRRVGSNETVKVDVRVLAATNEPLEKMIAAGTFREDLYYRLNVIPINISPLRERREDILPLAQHIIRQQVPAESEAPGLSQEACRILENYRWPGNVRELENAMRHALAFTQDGGIDVDVLPARIIESSDAAGAPAPDENLTGFEGERCKSLKAFLRTKEKQYLSQVLTFTDGDKAAAAEKLKISLATLYRKLPDEQ